VTISKARAWIEDVRLGRIASFAEIAQREGQCERHIRLLAPLAFVSPRIVTAIVDGAAPADLTVTGLAKALPHSWAEQEQRIGLAGIQLATDPDCFQARDGTLNAPSR
jgi:site-specific DNA recombinase